MAIGPVQLLALGFSEPKFRGEILDELARLRESDTVRVIDSLTVYKDAQGEVTTLEASQMDEAARRELGSVVGALIGLGEAGVAGAEAGAAITSAAVVAASARSSFFIVVFLCWFEVRLYAFWLNRSAIRDERPPQRGGCVHHGQSPVPGD